MLRRSVLFIVFTLSFSITVPAKAQLLRNYGIRGGGNESNISGYLIDFESTPGFQVAAFAEFSLSKVFSIQAELEYARRGYSMEQEETNASGQSLGTVRGIYGLDYLSIPILVRMRYSGRSKIIPYAIAGPRLDFLYSTRPGLWKFSIGTWEIVKLISSWPSHGSNLFTSSRSGHWRTTTNKPQSRQF